MDYREKVQTTGAGHEYKYVSLTEEPFASLNAESGGWWDEEYVECAATVGGQVQAIHYIGQGFGAAFNGKTWVEMDADNVGEIIDDYIDGYLGNRLTGSRPASAG